MGKQLPALPEVSSVVIKSIGIAINQRVQSQKLVETTIAGRQAFIPENVSNIKTWVEINFEILDSTGNPINFSHGPEVFVISLTDDKQDEKKLLGKIDVLDLVAQVKSKWSGEVF